MASRRFRDVFEFVRRLRASSANRLEGMTSLAVVPAARNIEYHYCMSRHKGLQQLIIANASGSKEPNANKGDAGNKMPLAPQPSPGSMFRRWAAWIVGFLATVVLPMWKTKWERIRQIEGDVEVAVEEVDKVAKVVEKVAAVTERVSEELVKAFPGESKLKEAALVVEKLSKIAAADAAIAENIINKMEVVKKDFQELEKAVQPASSPTSSDEQPKL